MYAIQTTNLGRRFGRHHAIQDIHLAVPAGQIFGYLGLNGAGKTTTIKILCTLLPSTQGDARVHAADVRTDAVTVRGQIGLVGDEAGDSKPTWTAREYLRYFAALKSSKDQVEPLLDLVGLEPVWRNRPISTYSTGMKRRVELARALLGKPRVLFLDEPTRGLDLPAKRAVWTLLKRLCREERMTIFLSSHDVMEIRALCDNLAVLAKGRIVYRGNLAALGRTPEAFEQTLIRLLEAGPAAHQRPASATPGPRSTHRDAPSAPRPREPR